MHSKGENVETEVAYPICNTFIMYQKVHLLLDNIAVVVVEGDERCLGAPQMHRPLFRFSELHNRHFLHGSSQK